MDAPRYSVPGVGRDRVGRFSPTVLLDLVRLQLAVDQEPADTDQRYQEQLLHGTPIPLGSKSRTVRRSATPTVLHENNSRKLENRCGESTGGLVAELRPACTVPMTSPHCAVTRPTTRCGCIRGQLRIHTARSY